MDRNNVSLRRMTNLTTLSDSQLIQRAVDYFIYLNSRIPYINNNKTLLMDETAIYFDDARTQTVDFKGRSHVVLKSTGYSSMRITMVASVWANGNKAPPLIIHKGKDSTMTINRQSGPILYTSQEKAWINENIIIKWIDVMFPYVEICEGK